MKTYFAFDHWALRMDSHACNSLTSGLWCHIYQLAERYCAAGCKQNDTDTSPAWLGVQMFSVYSQAVGVGQFRKSEGRHCVSLQSHAGENRKGGKLEVGLVRPALSFSFLFLSLCAWVKSTLGEPDSCCQATRLPGSRALMNSHRVMEVALPTRRRTRGRTGTQDKHMHVCKHMPACGILGQPEPARKHPTEAVPGLLY